MRNRAPETHYNPDREEDRFDPTAATRQVQAKDPDGSHELSSSSQGRSIKKILVPTDFTPSDFKAVQHAVGFARMLGAGLTLLHVIDITDPSWLKFAGSSDEFMRQLRTKANSEMGKLRKSLTGESIEVESLIVEGIPWDEIANRTTEFDLVIMSRARSLPFWRLFSKRTTQRVIDRAQSGICVVQE